MIQKRIFSPRERKSAVRDARLIIIATEGEQTEKKYFYDLARFYHNPKIHVEILDRFTNASSPEKIVELLDKFRQKYYQDEDDELWLVIDVDQWGEKKLAGVARGCQQKNYLLAVSNPCFELWLLLHIKSLDEYSNDILNEFRENKKTNNRSRLETELLDLLGSYNKRKIDTGKFFPTIELAIQRAKSLDRQPDHRWPNDLGSRVYRLVESIIGKR